MPKIAESRADVHFQAGVACARSSVQIRYIEQCDAGHAVEVKPRVQLIGTSQPPGAEGDFIFAPVDDGGAVGQCRLRVIVHMLGRAGGNQMKHVIGGIVGVHDDLAEMVSDDAPGRGAIFE